MNRMSWRRTSCVAAAGCALVLGLAACAATPASVTVNGRTLVLYQSTGVIVSSLVSGRIGTNPKGCVTLGNAVLMVPGGSFLLGNGSIQIEGKTLKQGRFIRVAGAVFPGKPPAVDCGTGVTYVEAN